MKYFGTDGIRGNVVKLFNYENLLNISKGIMTYIKRHNVNNKILIGCDTRNSCDYIFSVLSGILLYNGINIDYLGIVPTACVSYLLRNSRYDLGIMISASHNTFNDNGLKIFDRNGFKLSNNEENEIEKYINNSQFQSKINIEKGVINYNQNLVANYIDSLKILKKKCNLKVVVDCSNGSNYIIANKVFDYNCENYKIIGNAPNGFNINKDCGSQNIDYLKNYLIKNDFDIGFAFDGDADRLRVVTKDGNILDGDDLLYVFAKYLKSKNMLLQNTVVGTIMNNEGLKDAFSLIGINLIRVDVGDKNVISEMNKNKILIGGETSGHICILDKNSSCDAMYNAVFLLSILSETNLSIDDLLYGFKRYKQVSNSLEVSLEYKNLFNENINLIKKVDKYSQDENARIVVRPSGTENLIRIMVESCDGNKAREVLSCIENDIKFDYSSYVKKYE